jgi:hypothetical protein
MHLSWLDPHTTRRLTVVGSKRMAIVDELEVERKLTIYGGTASPALGRPGEMRVRMGNVVSPHISDEHPIALECEHFVSSIRSGRHVVANTGQAASAVRVLASLQRSLERGGLPEPVGAGRLSAANVTPLVPRARRASARS